VISVPIYCRRLIGRERELQLLVERRRALAKSHGALVLLSGDAGLGKSRLVRAFLEKTQSARSRVAVAQCRPFGDRPYGAILDLLEAFAPAAERASAGSSRDDHQKRLVDGLLNASEKHALVAVIEDLHWADRGTAEILERLCASIATRRILVVATYRSDEIHQDHPLYVPIAAVMRKAAVWTVPLQPLSARETAEFVDATLEEGATSVSRQTRRDVMRICEGNPFFAEELLKGAIDNADAERSGSVLPTTVRAAILQRMEPLDARDRRILTQAAVIGRRFAGDVLAQTLDASFDALLPTLQRARRCQLVEETDDPRVFRFRHALTREAIYDDLLAAQRRPLHERIARTLEAGDGERVLEDLAYHWWACGNRDKALLYGERAGDTALREYEYAGAIAAYERTLRLLEPLERDAARVNEKIGTAHYRAGFMDRAIEHYEVAWEFFRTTRDDPAYLFRTARNVAGALHNDGRVADSLALWNEAAAVVSACGDERWTTLTQVQRAAYLVDAGYVSEALAALAAVDPERIEGDFELALGYWGSLCVASALQGDLAGLRAGAERIFAMRPGRGNLGPLSDALLEAGSAALYVGETACARRCFEEALTACVTMKSTDMLLADTLLVGAFERLLAGAYDAARDAARRALSLVGETKISWQRARVVGAWLNLATGEPNPAGALTAAHLDDAFATGKPQIYGPLAAAAAEAAVRRGEEREARALQRRALDAALEAASSLGSFPLVVTAAGACDASDAKRVRALAARDAAKGPAPAAAAALAEALLERRFGDAERAREHARRAAGGFAVAGWPYFEALARAEADDAGSNTGRSRAALTPRESEIAELVAGGHSNREVARALFVSVKLVEKQLSSIYQKFGIRSRTQLAARLLARASDAAPDAGRK